MSLFLHSGVELIVAFVSRILGAYTETAETSPWDVSATKAIMVPNAINVGK